MKGRDEENAIRPDFTWEIEPSEWKVGRNLFFCFAGNKLNVSTSGPQTGILK